MEATQQFVQPLFSGTVGPIEDAEQWDENDAEHLDIRTSHLSVTSKVDCAVDFGNRCFLFDVTYTARIIITGEAPEDLDPDDDPMAYTYTDEVSDWDQQCVFSIRADNTTDFEEVEAQAHGFLLEVVADGADEFRNSKAFFEDRQEVDALLLKHYVDSQHALVDKLTAIFGYEADAALSQRLFNDPIVFKLAESLVAMDPSAKGRLPQLLESPSAGFQRPSAKQL